MSMIKNDNDKHKASLFLITDMLENILSYASNPGQCAEYITSQLRELVGAKIVALVQTPIDPEFNDFSIISVYPKRHAARVMRSEVSDIYQSDMPTAVLKICPDVQGNKAARALHSLGFRDSFVIPLNAGNERVGALLIFDLLSTDGAQTVIDAIQSLSGVIGLVFKNTMFYQKLDVLVKERTQTLELEINEREKAEHALYQSEKRFRNTFENASIGMCVTNIEGKLLMVNSAMGDMLGYHKEELNNKNFSDYTHPDDIAFSFEQMKPLLENKSQSTHFEKRYIRKSGNVVWAKIGTFLSRDDNGTPEYFITHIEDITQQKIALKEKEELEEQLRQSHKMEAIGTLAGGIAHDFNNILSIVLGNVELAMDDMPEWNSAIDSMNEIKEASLRAKDVVRQLLSFARKSDQKRKPINISETIKGSLSLLRSSIPTSIDIHKNIHDDCGSVLADPTQINQIMMNVCLNASHAMPKGGILDIKLNKVSLDEKAVSQHPGLRPGNYVKLSIRDTGHGIPPENIERIFDPYFTTKDVGKGSGIGLSVVHGIISSHEGKIFTESELEKGTTFHIFLPAIDKDAEPADIKAQSQPTGHERILFVDDEEAIVKMSSLRLKRLGYNVTSHTRSHEALKIFQSNPDMFDLVITDLTMPNMSGERLTQELLKIKPTVRIILCTGYNEKMTENRARVMGARGYLEKPHGKEDLATIIRNVLDTPS